MKLHYILFTSIVLVFALEDNMMAQWTTESGSTIYACQFVSMLDTGNGWGLGYSSFYPFDTTVVYRRLPPWGWDVEIYHCTQFLQLF
jgi:hypothetical protein